MTLYSSHTGCSQCLRNTLNTNYCVRNVTFCIFFHYFPTSVERLNSYYERARQEARVDVHHFVPSFPKCTRRRRYLSSFVTEG